MNNTGFKAYLPELMLNTLFFFILSCVIVCLLARTYFFRQDTKELTRAITTCSQAAEYFRSTNGSLDKIAEYYPSSIEINQQLFVYLNEEFLLCNSEKAVYFLMLQPTDSQTMNIYLYKGNNDVIYSIEEVVRQ